MLRQITFNVKPPKGTCDGRGGKYNCCGATEVYLGCKSRGQCVNCSNKYKMARRKPPKSKSAPKNIVANKEYYARQIAANIIKNGGVCRCDNCFVRIAHPTGRNVSHIVSAGANIALYHEDINNYILCALCEDIWTSGDKTVMRIYEESEQRRMELNLKYYAQKKPIQ